MTLAVRMLLIVSLTAWSPAWCCCAIRAMAAGEAGFGSEAPRLSCCSREASTPAERPTRSCCSFVEADGCAKACDEEHPCRCADRMVEHQRLDTSIKISAPRVNVDFAALPFDHAGPRVFIDVTDRSLIARGLNWHPPPRTLLAQSCLLLL